MGGEDGAAVWCRGRKEWNKPRELCWVRLNSTRYDSLPSSEGCGGLWGSTGKIRGILWWRRWRYAYWHHRNCVEWHRADERESNAHALVRQAGQQIKKGQERQQAKITPTNIYQKYAIVRGK